MARATWSGWRFRSLSQATLIAFVISLPLTVPSSASATHVWLGKSEYRLSAKGSNGYRLRLSTYENRLYHRISLTAENDEGQSVRYSVQGAPKNGRINAIFPGVGEIHADMHPSRLKELPPPKGCKLPKAVIEYGAFVGRIKFRGEMGYTELSAKKVHGAIERSKRQECQLVRSARPTGHRRIPQPGISHFTTLQLVNGHVVVNATTPAGGTEASFEAGAHEERNGMVIERVSRGVTSSGDFEASPDLTSATISPPPPFLGTATYSGPPRSTGCPFPCPPPVGQVSGSLRLRLPGLGVVPLTGPQVEATLSMDVIAF